MRASATISHLVQTKTVLILAAAAVGAVAATLVVLSLREPTVAMYSPTPPAPRDVGGALVGPVLYTVDATRPEPWRYFAFRMGSVIENPGARDWDLAFRRYEIIANGGPAFVGAGGVADLGEVAFAVVKVVPRAATRRPRAAPTRATRPSPAGTATATSPIG